MSDLHELLPSWEAFKEGRPEAFRYYFQLHNYRIYCYLLRRVRDQARAKELLANAFIQLFRCREIIIDEEHLLRQLYLNARAGLEPAYCAIDDPSIMDDLDIARNETLITLVRA